MSESEVAIVTGAAQGLGAAISEVLLKKGYKVCVADIQEEKGKQFVREQQEKYGTEKVKFIVCDVTKESDYKGIFDFTLKEFKRIDLVVNNAGVVLEQNPKKTVDINLMGPIIGCQLALQYMGKSNGGKGGMVVNTASITGLIPHHAIPVYAATKHGVVGLTRSYGMPYHLEKDGVLFTAICPSYTDTSILLLSKTNSLIKGLDSIKDNDDIMPVEFVAEGVSKLLEDRINGSTLVITKKKGYHYVGLQKEFDTISMKE